MYWFVFHMYFLKKNIFEIKKSYRQRNDLKIRKILCPKDLFIYSTINSSLNKLHLLSFYVPRRNVSSITSWLCVEESCAYSKLDGQRHNYDTARKVLCTVCYGALRHTAMGTGDQYIFFTTASVQT